MLHKLRIPYLEQRFLSFWTSFSNYEEASTQLGAGEE